MSFNRVVCFVRSHEFARGLVEVQEEVKEEGVGHVAMRNLFSLETSSMETITVEKKSRKRHIRESADRLELSKKVTEFRKKQNSDNLTHPPEFIVRPRGQTVWEGKTVKLHCTVSGWPKPRIAWYKNNVVIDEKAHPDKYTAESNYNMHSLEIKSCDFLDTAQYRVSALNIKGESSSVATVVIKSIFKRRVVLGIIVLPLSTMGTRLEGVPVAPLDVRCHDANKDYVVVTWKQPAVEGSSSILGYFIDRCEVGHHHWAQCNDTPVKYARFPVTGLIEGRSYTFRVRAINRAGVSRPSRASDPVTAIDPHDRARHRAGPSAPFTGMIKFTEEDATVGVVPGEPTDLVVTEATKNYVVLAWSPPAQRGHEGVVYLVEKPEMWQKVAKFKGAKYFRKALYTVDIYSNSAGMSELSSATGDITVGDMLDLPAAPGPAVATRNTDTSVVVSWGASKDVKHLVGYYINYTVAGSDVWTPANNKPVKGTRFVCHGLNTGDSCVFRVKAVNAAGYSHSSLESEAVVVKAGIAIPGVPSGVHLMEAARDYMVLAWREPAVTGGADIRGYFVDYRTVKGGVEGQWHELNPKAVTCTSYKAENLKENLFYQFQVRAINMAGVSEASLPSAALECKEWTIAKPGAPHDLHVLEVRDSSLVLLWEPPTFDGRTPVNGFYVDIKEAVAGEDWKGVHEKATKLKYMKVNGLIAGRSYVFRVRAQNLAGVGKTSAVLGPVLALTMPGTHEIILDVDDDGVISMIFECSEMAEGSEFIWSKNYKTLTDTSRLTIVTEGGKSRAIFNAPSLEDLGIFSCEVTNTVGVSASYTLTEAGESLSHFATQMAMELLEKGRVRFWTQVEKFTTGCHVDYVFNDAIVENGEKYQMNFDKNSGIIEMFMDSLAVTDEGTFTFNLVDGKAKGSTSLVLIGEGPHFVDYLGFQVTPECNVLLKATVRFYNSKLSKKDAGVYEVKLKDARGKDKSMFNLTEAGTATPLLCSRTTYVIVKSTEHGIVLYSLITYHMEDLQVGWLHKEAKIAHSDRVQCGVTGEQLWLKVNEPTEKDKGKYTINICDGKDGVKRFCDLSGQDRARVVGGLPDVVTIQEGKSLNLTGNVWGDPAPEVTWMKNDRELVSDERYALKFEHGKFASITIAAVTTTDSGKYALLVKNKYGTEAGEFTVSVYIPEEEKKKE
uniref:Myomesin 1a (skelemin) n=1 Tax=Oncorhynchus mykiss TaxID=8022 RepID=A0A8K9XF93_ONCMY